MMSTRWNQRFLSSTRGQILTLLRGVGRTVNELAAALSLTDNAIRAHLTALERDGLVQQQGVRRGLRKPYFAYELTAAAAQFFPKAYDVLLKQVLTVLQTQHPTAVVEEMLREVGRQLGASQLPAGPQGSLAERVSTAGRFLGELGGLATIEQQADTFWIRGTDCPLAAVVVDHPQVCQLAESLVAELTGATVQASCLLTETPQCRFRIAASGQ